MSEEMNKPDQSGAAVRGEAVAQLVPKFAGQFETHQDWVNRAQRVLSVPEHKPRAVCVDAKGRRCHIGADMARACDEDAFPVRYFWECELAPVAQWICPDCGNGQQFDHRGCIKPVSPRAADALDSQPVPASIGDDAQFKDLLLAWHTEYRYNTFVPQASQFKTFNDLVAYIDSRASAAPAASTSGWISVDDRLPPLGEQVIAYRPTAALTQDPPTRLVRFTGNTRESWQGVSHGFDCMCHPSHWMPLPPAPQQEGREAGNGN